MDWERDASEAAETMTIPGKAQLDEQALDLQRSIADIINAAV